jgi:hypothetical protein
VLGLQAGDGVSRFHPTVEERFKAAVVGLDALGLPPSPTNLNLVLRGFARRTLNGKEARWRAEQMLALGYVRLDVTRDPPGTRLFSREYRWRRAA